MWRAVIADDEIVILRGLKKLIKWESIDVEIVGEASDGSRLEKIINELNPDLVISDIKMPGKTGLDVMTDVLAENRKPQFIFISAYEEFSYAKEALSKGAVDYLLKPVSRKDLEESVIKATKRIKTENTAGLFTEEKQPIEEIFERINRGETFAAEELEKAFDSMDIAYKNREFRGVTYGLMERGEFAVSKKTIEAKNLERIRIFNELSRIYTENEIGFCVGRDNDRIHFILSCPKNEGDIYMESTAIPAKTHAEIKYKTRLCMGVGNAVSDITRLQETYQTADKAFELYFFEERPIIYYNSISGKKNAVILDISAATDDIFKSIISKDGQFMRKVDALLGEIGKAHYGNKYACSSRIMIFTGDLGSKLYDYDLLTGDFYEMQDKLQAQLENVYTFSEMKDCVMRHYELLLPEIYKSLKGRDRMQIEQVKTYIKENYAKDLSVKELAEVACVSPNYFSTLFKKETGENYKNYLTSIRLEEAVKLLFSTDMKSYEIGYRVGYNNARRFVDAFKNIYGMSPSEYKRKMKDE